MAVLSFLANHVGVLPRPSSSTGRTGACAILLRVTATPSLPLQLQHFADLSVQVDRPIEVGATPAGRRRMVPITGGEARGHGWTARVLPGGADYQLIASDTRAELEAHYLLETEAGERIYVRNQAIRVAPPDVSAAIARGEPVDPSQVYFRCVPTLQTAAPSLHWINDRLFAGCGQRLPDRVVMSFYALC